MHKELRKIIENGQRDGWIAGWTLTDGRYLKVTTVVGEVIICNAEPGSSRAVASTLAIFKRARRDALASRNPSNGGLHSL